MLEIRFIRENPEAVKADLKKRGMLNKIKQVDDIIKKDVEYRKLLQESEKLRHRRNLVTNEINLLKKQGKNISKVIREAKEIPAKIKKIEEKQEKLKQELVYILMRIPNILHKSVPVGKDKNDNKTIRKIGAKPKFSFKPKSHVDLLELLDIGDIERAAKVSGARFYYLKRDLVMLDFALMKFALDSLDKKGYILIEPPFMIRRKPYEGVTDLSDFEEMLYKIKDEDLYLIATSEHPIAAMHMNEVLEELPLKYAGISPCFRKEAGSHGKDTKGIFRVHQFNKIEMFIFSKLEESWKYHEELIKNAEELFKKLKLPYRITNICTGDIGTIASKKYDLDIWYPVQQKYREVVSCSNCTSYQATRLNIKYKTKQGKEYVHTLNSTAIATSRTMAAILENYQNKDGSVTIPKVLIPYMNGKKKIEKVK